MGRDRRREVVRREVSFPSHLPGKVRRRRGENRVDRDRLVIVDHTNEGVHGVRNVLRGRAACIDLEVMGSKVFPAGGGIDSGRG